MPGFFKRLIYSFSNQIANTPEKYLKKKITVDFTKSKHLPFNIKPEQSNDTYFNACLSNKTLELGLKKNCCIGWVEIPECELQDHIINAKISLESCGGYAAAGLMFHIKDDETYYLLLVSNKGFFRLDAVKDNNPRALIAWTEVSDYTDENISIKIISFNTDIILVINNKWAGAASDDSIISGSPGFALASYEIAQTLDEGLQDKIMKDNIDKIDKIDENENIDKTEAHPLNDIETPHNTQLKKYACKANLFYFMIDTRTKFIEDEFKKYNDEANINAESHLRLAHTYAAMGESAKSLEQIEKAWKKRDETIRSITVSYTEVKTKKELLLACQMSFRLEQFDRALEYADSILDQWPSSAEGKETLSVKIRILNELGKYNELKEFALTNFDSIKKDADFYALLAASYMKLNEYEASAKEWINAFKMSGETENTLNGIYAANAASTLELAEKKDEALAFYLEAGKIFLREDNRAELTVMIPKLASLGKRNWEARVLSGKWAFYIEDYALCEKEFAKANKLRCAERPRPKADPAHYYLWALVLHLRGKNEDALRLLEKAVKLAPDYGMFRFKLAEIKVLSGVEDKHIADDFKKALENIDETDSNKKEMTQLAGSLLLKAGDKENAKFFLEPAQKDGN